MFKTELKEVLGVTGEKTIAVVGNGPSILGKGLGKEIDDHEVVIRFNAFMTAGYEQDTGRRMNVWCTCFSRNLFRHTGLRNIANASAVLFPRRAGLLNQKGLRRDLIKECKGKLVCKPTHLDRELCNRLKKRPTSGVSIVHWLFREGFKTGIYGFDCYDNGYHYFGDKKRRVPHDRSGENQLLKEILCSRSSEPRK